MKIGFEAKRAFTNGTGLGHYSRTLISSLAKYFVEDDYYLFTPKQTNLFKIDSIENIKTIIPTHFPASIFRSAWRSSWVKKDLVKLGIDIYHGLSHEIPFGIQNTSVKSVVTMHDLIFERNPEQYNPIDVKIYRKKFKYACVNANHIIAISHQTKNDLIDFYNIICMIFYGRFKHSVNFFNHRLYRAHRKLKLHTVYVLGVIISSYYVTV